VAEDTNRGFAPWIGTISQFSFPEEDWAAVYTHVPFDRPYTIPSEYDPNLALVLVWGDDMAMAKNRARQFLDGTVIEGRNSHNEMIMTNIPTVFIGGMVGVLLTGGSFNLAHMVGFIALTGIVSRNGIMLVGRCLSLVQKEGLSFTPETTVKATLDRVVPVLMTALTTAPALIPLIIFGGEPGKEMLFPLATVIFGGLISSTAISLFLTPALFYRFGKKAALKITESRSGF